MGKNTTGTTFYLLFGTWNYVGINELVLQNREEQVHMRTTRPGLDAHLPHIPMCGSRDTAAIMNKTHMHFEKSVQEKQESRAVAQYPISVHRGSGCGCLLPS
jgi:hypothetical protein